MKIASNGNWCETVMMIRRLGQDPAGILTYIRYGESYSGASSKPKASLILSSIVV